jgi:hypothetical protein
MAWLTLKRGLIIAVVLVLIPVAWAAWWLGSPLFIDKTVEEEFPLAFSAVVPEGMKRSEVEKVMETMAKVDSPREEPMGEVMAVAVALKKGEFRGVGHRGEGTATIYMLADGTHVLRLESFKTSNGPDLHVVLTSHADPAHRTEVKQEEYIDLAKLKGNIGSQNYPLPAGSEPADFNTVVIYCNPFNVIFAVAPLEAGSAP